MYPENQHRAALTFLRVENGPLLKRIYELRYQVYCLDRGFLPCENYPSDMESDEFDPHAMHFAALDSAGHVVGTARLVLNSRRGLPLDRYFQDEGDLHFRGVPRSLLGEISRLAVRAPVRQTRGGQTETQNYRRPEIALGLYEEIYSASRKAGLSHLLAAMERPLGRLLARYSFPFRAAGPEIDYYGPVRPYLLDIAQGERELFERCPTMFARFVDGLPVHLRPGWHSRADEKHAAGGMQLPAAACSLSI